ncbi:MAG: anhydro-N-acetylmuramic acid kinase [Trueperaceae bacterium]|nr:anhydro-N-acetylmuramic acid kinase [Trueperaceae bacterium]
MSARTAPSPEPRPAPAASEAGLRVVGVMSGTSMDGADAVAVRLQREGAHLAWEVLARASLPYPDALRDRLHTAIRPGGGDVVALTRLHAELGEHVAVLVASMQDAAPRPAGEDEEPYDLVVMSGQTVYHIPRPDPERGWDAPATLQLGEPSRVVERCGLPVVSDLRQADLAAGGQGAPMVPFGDLLLYGQAGIARAVHNLGGISNLTWLPPDGDPDRVLAFDTGPANCLLDELAAAKAGLAYDEGGRLASAGRVDDAVLERLMAHPYLRLLPPKTTGREVFHLGELGATGLAALPTEDALATASEFTAASVAEAYRAHVRPRGLDEVLLAGGGARNPDLVARLRRHLRPLVATVDPFEARGWDSRDREALAFAVMGYEAWHGRVNTLPAATGALHAVIGGRISLPPR